VCIIVSQNRFGIKKLAAIFDTYTNLLDDFELFEMLSKWDSGKC